MATISKNGITLSTDRGSGDATITATATQNTSHFPKVTYFTISASLDVYVTVKFTQPAYTPYEVSGEGITQIGDL